MRRTVSKHLLVLIVLLVISVLFVGCPSPTQGDPGDEQDTENQDDQNDQDSSPDDPGDPVEPGITLSPTDFALRVGTETTITATVAGDGVTQAVDWSVENDSVLQLSDETDTEVTITAIAAGTTTVVASLRDDNTVTESIDGTAYIVSVILGDPNEEPYEIAEDESRDLQALLQILPSDHADQSVSWSSNDPDVVSVDSDGLAFGEGVGSATVTATSTEDPTKSDSVSVTVTPGATTVDIQNESGTSIADTGLVVGDTFQVLAEVSPFDRPQDVTWQSDDESVATVSATGRITAVAQGTAAITATSTYNSAATDTIDVTVSPLRQISGIVTVSVGGAPLDGSSVVATNESDPSRQFNTTTDANGEFTLADVYPGVYTVDLSQNGYAGSRVQGVHVIAENASIELVQYPVAFAGRSVEPPTITVSGVTAGQTYDDTVMIGVTATAAGSNRIAESQDRPALLLNIDAPATQLDYVARSSSETLSYTWDASAWPEGDVVIEAVAYDTNNNRSALRTTVSTPGDTFSPPAYTVDSRLVSLVGVTYGQDQSIFAADPDTTSFVSALIESVPGTYGIRMYRATNSGGPWTLIAQTYQLVTDGTDTFFEIEDTSPDLLQGTTYYYEFAFFDKDGEGPRSTAYSLTLLPSYDVTLVSPQDDGVITDSTPELVWSVDGSLPAGTVRTDIVYIARATSGTAEVVLVEEDPTSTSVTLTDPLGSGLLYEWNVISSARLDGSHANVYSLSYPTTPRFNGYLGGLGSHASNGSFQFTIE